MRWDWRAARRSPEWGRLAGLELGRLALPHPSAARAGRLGGTFAGWVEWVRQRPWNGQARAGPKKGPRQTLRVKRRPNGRRVSKSAEAGALTCVRYVSAGRLVASRRHAVHREERGEWGLRRLMMTQTRPPARGVAERRRCWKARGLALRTYT